MEKKIETLISLRSSIVTARIDLLGDTVLGPGDYERFMTLSDDELRADLRDKGTKAALKAAALEKLDKAGLTDEEKQVILK